MQIVTFAWLESHRCDDFARKWLPLREAMLIVSDYMVKSYEEFRTTSQATFGHVLPRPVGVKLAKSYAKCQHV